MASNSALIMNAFFANYDGFEGVKSLVDVGGGVGSAASIIVKKFPHIRAINFDLPHVIASAPKDIPGMKNPNFLNFQQSTDILVTIHEIVAGVEHVAGDMFESVPSADVILLKVK